LSLFWWAWCRTALWAVRAVLGRGIFLRLSVMLGMAGLWVVIEWVRGIVFTGLPWLPLSVSQWERPLLLQIASVTGGAGISFTLMAFNFGLAYYLYTLWHNRKARWLKRISPEFYLALGILFAAIGYGLQSAGATNRNRIPGPRLGFVQPNVGVLQKWDSNSVSENLRVLDDLTTYASFLEADLILWPEAPTPMPVKGNASMQRWVEDLSQRLELPMLIGNVAYEELEDNRGRHWYNAVFLVDPQTGVNTEAYYAKRHLVPFGEYVPLAGWIPFIRKFVPIEGDFGRGISARTLEFKGSEPDIGRIGNLICFEDIFPSLARANVLAGADWHYVATNNVWFGEEAGAWQHAAHSVMRAVETRRPVVRCGNAGWSGWIDEFGHIRHTLLDDKGSIYFQGVEAVNFSRNAWWANRLSPYVRYGDWFTAVCAGLVFLGWGTIRLSLKRGN
ncbi:MAG TPA: apolipoprotein N-acyltransferase, partial [Oceanipulchritudo sp.]|nr:apolipoprotein N-acyltransferase [Oceanipulchritudo sp.]